MTEQSVNLEGLPRLLVDDVLNQTGDISKELLEAFEELRKNRQIWQKKLRESKMIARDSDLPIVQIPTTCGVDGSYAVERLLAVDLVVAGAVVVEGLTPPTETRFWHEPFHFVYVKSEKHNPDTGSILRAIMIGMELLLAKRKKAPHDVVFLDGSLTTPLIYFNQALNKAKQFPNLDVSKFLFDKIMKFFEAYSEILGALHTDHQWVAVPKYTSNREIGEKLGASETFDDRALLSSTLEAGAYTRPIKIKKPTQEWHINTSMIKNPEIKKIKDRIIQRLYGIHVVYYRPHKYIPALRLEITQPIVKNEARLSKVLQAVKYQCGMPGIMEPYPLYLADKTVKHLAQSLPIFRQITNQNLSTHYEGDIDDIFVGLHSYRTETGR